MEQYIPKSALVAEIEKYKKEALERLTTSIERPMRRQIKDKAWVSLCQNLLSVIDTLEVKEVNEVPATVMVNQYGLRFISSWSGLKEYDDFKKGEEIKILIPKK